MQKKKGNTETHKSAEKMSDGKAEERHGKRNYQGTEREREESTRIWGEKSD